MLVFISRVSCGCCRLAEVCEYGAIAQVQARQTQDGWDQKGREAPASTRSANDPNQANTPVPAAPRDLTSKDMNVVWDLYERELRSKFKSHCREKWGGHEWYS